MKISEVKKCDAADAVDADTIETPYIISDDSPPRRIPTTLSFSVFFLKYFFSLFLFLFSPLFLFRLLCFHLPKWWADYTRHSDIQSVAICVQWPVFIDERLFSIYSAHQ